MKELNEEQKMKFKIALGKFAIFYSDHLFECEDCLKKLKSVLLCWYNSQEKKKKEKKKEENMVLVPTKRPYNKRNIKISSVSNPNEYARHYYHLVVKLRREKNEV